MRRIEELTINPQLLAVSPQKSEDSYRKLEASILSGLRVNKAIEYSEDGDIVDGMHRAKIILANPDKEIDYQTTCRGEMTLFEKKSYILVEVHTSKEYSHHQKQLVYYLQVRDIVEDTGCTIPEATAIVANEFANEHKKFDALFGEVERAYEFGKLANGCIPEVPRFMFDGGRLTRPELIKLAQLDHETQRLIYESRIGSGNKDSWTTCRKRVLEIPEREVITEQLDNMKRAKASIVWTLRDWRDEVVGNGEDEILKAVGFDFAEVLEAADRKLKAGIFALEAMESRGSV